MKSCSTFMGIAFILMGCATSPRPDSERMGVEAKIFKATYDQAWQATLKALTPYQLSTSNKDAGIIETDFKKSTTTEHLAYFGEVSSRRSNDLKWKLKIQLLQKTPGTVSIHVEKFEYQSPGFLEAYERTSSNFLLEKALLYRIGRLIQIDQKISKLLTKPDRNLN